MIENNSTDIVFQVKKTQELNNDEIEQINNLYNKVFENLIKIPRSKEEFINKFTNNEKQYSFHGLMKKNNKIIGSYPVIPNKFNYFKSELFFGLAVDTVIDREYQGNLDNLLKLNFLVYKKLKEEKIYFIYGIANLKYYKIVKSLLLYKDVCNLNYYIKPLKIKNIYVLGFLINIMIFFLNTANKICKNLSFSQNIKKNIYHNKFNFIQTSFEKFNDVTIIDCENFKFAYKIKKEKKFGIPLNCLYIFEVFPFTEQNIFKTVKFCEKKFNDLNLIIYLTSNIITCSNLFKVPNYFLKNKIIVSGKILDDSIVKDIIYKSNNWNLNLSNFDIK